MIFHQTIFNRASMLLDCYNCQLTILTVNVARKNHGHDANAEWVIWITELSPLTWRADKSKEDWNEKRCGIKLSILFCFFFSGVLYGKWTGHKAEEIRRRNSWYVKAYNHFESKFSKQTSITLAKPVSHHFGLIYFKCRIFLITRK